MRQTKSASLTHVNTTEAAARKLQCLGLAAWQGGLWRVGSVAERESVGWGKGVDRGGRRGTKKKGRGAGGGRV